MSSASADQTDAFTAFLSSMDDRLNAFIAHGLPETVEVGDEERTFVKDLSPASLPWIEAYAVSRLPTPALASAPANQRLAEDLMRYVGETFLRTLGGSWQHDPDGSDHGMPYVQVPDPGDDAAPAHADPEARPGTEAEPEARVTIDVSVLGLLMTALQNRTGDVFVSALLGIAGVDEDAEPGGPTDP
ncbi:hypothetical protein [Brevibacterium jeotgali]|uniref:Uncharacterized protein n=1 Tax=Brevibacterium jeotgali TaxID=1262550 RepID=A0A2H1L1K7_9MICO|nr:hypothetical protein [Brevibacterium jeotgali]TWC01930.1 hypothetical protein FB108_0588 [Brevibacterium jeotgali]SMY10719.1 hypothetical protein BJEO58_00294 [Brevibacterium jeotgali]